MINKFLKNNDGGASIEFALWMPLMGLILMLGADASMLMHRQTTDAQPEITQRFSNSAAYKGDVTVANGYVIANVSVPFTEVTVFSGRVFGQQELTGRVVMWQGDTGEDTSDETVPGAAG